MAIGAPTDPGEGGTSPMNWMDWIVDNVSDALGPLFNYTNPETEETEETTTTYTTHIVSHPELRLRDHKYVLVSEMPDFYSDEELNTPYHNKSEYQNANTKYGYIYKNVKFSNADNVNDLFAYAKDWIKNNYHGGLVSFSITALDMHMLGQDTDALSIGDQVNVIYVDPDTQTEIEPTTYTILGIEYDLNDPEKNTYQIGIPDLTLNKTYGEDKKGSGGGGGGGKPDPDISDEEKEKEEIKDRIQAFFDKMSEFWPQWIKSLNNDETDITDILTPLASSPTNGFLYTMATDFLKSGKLQASSGLLNNLKSGKIDVTGLIEAASANLGSAKIEHLTLTNALHFGTGSFSPVTITIGDQTYTLIGQSGS